MPSSLRPIVLAFTAASLSLLAVGCSSSDDAGPAPFVSSSRAGSEAEELADADVDPSSETIADEEELAEDMDDEIDLAQYEASADDSAIDEADESEEPSLDTLAFTGGLSPRSDTPNGEAVNGMKPRHCRVNGEIVKSCMCFFSPLSCQLPATQRGRNRIIPKKLYAEMVSRTAAKRANPGSSKPSDIKLPVFAKGWHIAPGTKLYDGNGVVRGTIKEKYASGKLANECDGYDGTNGYQPVGQGGTCTKINFGLKRKMDVEQNATMVYAFAVQTDGAGTASGWVKLSSIAESQRDELVQMLTIAGKRIAKSSFAPTSYVVRSAAEYGKQLPSWTEGKIVKPTGTCEHYMQVEKNAKVGDYIVRSNDTWNLAYNTPGAGGISVDTFIVAKDVLGFRRVRSTKARPTLVRVKVYCSAELKSMVFAYGAIETKSGPRYGWAPLRALRKGTANAQAQAANVAPPEPAPGPARTADGVPSNQPVPPSFCDGKPDGFACLPISNGLVGVECRSGAPATTVECPAFLHCAGPNASGTNITCTSE